MSDDRDFVATMTQSESGMPEIPEDFFDHPHKRAVDPSVGTPNMSSSLPLGGFGNRPGEASLFEGLATAEYFDPYAREMARRDHIHRTTAKISRKVASTYGRYYAWVDKVEDFKDRQGFVQTLIKKTSKEYRAYKAKQKARRP